MMCANVGEQRCEAAMGLVGTCPTCGSAVLAKCGSIKVWHWAHVGERDCDPWSENEGPWHRWWKARAPRERTEVTMGPHRADVVTERGTVIELQHSAISPEEIAEREAFYGKMVWLFDARSFASRMLFRRHAKYDSFRWLHPRKSLWACRAPVFFDMGFGRLFEVKRLHAEVPCGGWGHSVSLVVALQRFGLMPLSAAEDEEQAGVDVRYVVRGGHVVEKTMSYADWFDWWRLFNEPKEWVRGERAMWLGDCETFDATLRKPDGSTLPLLTWDHGDPL